MSKRRKDNDTLPPTILEALQQINPPPPTPREEMWRRIEAQRKAAKVVRPRFGARRWLLPAVAAAAVLVLGFLLGRVWNTTPLPDDAPSASAPNDDASETLAAAPTPGDTPVDKASPPLSRAQLMHAANHFSRSGVLLAQFAESAEDEEPLDPQLHEWARNLLTNTRLLLDSPLGKDPQYRKLLRDLEYTLASIVQASTNEGETEERRWVAGQVDESSLVERLQLVVPVLPGARDI
jgi:hypothetical protein